MLDRSRLVRLKITNIGCVGPEGLVIELDDILCLVGPNNTGKSTVLRAYELAAAGLRRRFSEQCRFQPCPGPLCSDFGPEVPVSAGREH